MIKLRGTTSSNTLMHIDDFFCLRLHVYNELRLTATRSLSLVTLLYQDVFLTNITNTAYIVAESPVPGTSF